MTKGSGDDRASLRLGNHLAGRLPRLGADRGKMLIRLSTDARCPRMPPIMVRITRFRRYTLRTLFICITIAAMPGWWLARKKAEYAAEQRAVAVMQNDYIYLAARSTYFGPGWIPQAYRPVWLDRVFAVDVTGIIYGVRHDYQFDHPIPFADGDLQRILPSLRELRHLQELQVPYTNVSDSAIVSLHALPRLAFVNAQQSLMTSEIVMQREAGPSMTITLGEPLPASMRLIRDKRALHRLQVAD